MSLILKLLHRLYRVLRSRRLATALILAWFGLLLVWIVPFQIYGLPAAQLRNIMYREPFFLWVYVALVLTTLTCVVSRVRYSWRRATRVPTLSSVPRLGGRATVLAGSWDPARAVAALDASRIAVRVEGDGWVWGVRSRYSSLGTLVSHAGLVLIVPLVAWWITQPAPFEGSAVVAEGERFEGSLASYVETSGAGVPNVSFDLITVEPEFHEDILLFTRLDSVLVDSAGDRHVVGVGSPWYPDMTTQVALDDFGWTTELIAGKDATTVAGPSVYKLQVFPPGSPDYIEIALDDVRFRLKVLVYGDYVDRDGEPGVASYNLGEPRVGLTVWRVLTNDRPILLFSDRIVTPGEQVDLIDGYSIALLDIGTYGKFRVSRVFPVPIALAVLAMITAGFAMRLLFPHTAVLIAPAEDGTVELRVRSEIYGDSRLAHRVIAAWNGSE